PWEGDRFPDVDGSIRPAASPADEALQADAEAAVRHAAVAPRVEVPLEELQRQAVALDVRQQARHVVLALAAADHLARALWPQAIRAEDSVAAHAGLDQLRLLVLQAQEDRVDP